MTDLAVDHDTKRPFSLPVLTIADGLLLLLVGLAAISRLANLARLPLSPSEAENGLAVWQFWQPGGMTTAVYSPLYFSLTALISQVVGLTDATVRLVPAMAGVALVASPVLFRRWLGNMGVLISSLLLAISPLATITSRTANGDALALLTAMGLAAGWLHWQTTGEKRWQTVTAVSLGLGLATSPLFYTALLTFGGAWWLQRKWGVGSEAWQETPHTPHPTPHSLLLPLLLTFPAATTLFLINPAGIGAAAQVAGQWLGQFGLIGNMADPFLVLLRYELPLLLGLLGVLNGRFFTNNEKGLETQRLGDSETNLPISQSPNLQSLVSLWLLLSLVIMLLQAGQTSNALLVLLPAYLLVGQLGNTFFAQTTNYLTGWLAGGLFFLAVLSFVNLARYLKLATINAPALSHLWFTTMGVIIAAFALYMVWTWEEKSAVYQGVLLALLGLFVFYQWGLGWNLAHQWGNDPRERWVQTATDDDIRLLLQMVRDVSRQGAGSDSDLELFSAMDSPLLRWYLRPFLRAQFGTAVPAVATQPLIITPASQTEPSFGSDYLGTDYAYLRPDVPVTLANSSSPLADTLRWWLFHTSPLPIPEERLIVWVRSDVGQP